MNCVFQKKKKSLGQGISRCCRAGHAGHTGSSLGPSYPRVPLRVAPGRQVLVPEDQRAGVAALSSWLGRARPASQALPSSGPTATRRCTAPPRTLSTRPSLTLGPNDLRRAKRQAPNLPLANLGSLGGVGPQLPDGGDCRSFLPPRLRGGTTAQGRSPRPPPLPRGPRGHCLHRRDPPPRQPPSPAERPPSPPATEQLASLPDVFSRISAAVSGRALPRRRSPPRGPRRPQPKATR